jgi:C4-dicarboxylate transporter DctM subunit
MLIAIIMVGIYGIPGLMPALFTPTEAAAVASVYAFIVANFIYRDMGPLSAGESLMRRPWTMVSAIWHRDTVKTLFEAGKLTVMLMFIIANALLLKHVLTDEQVPQALTSVLLDAGFGPVMFLIVVNLILLIGGQFMEPSGLIVIVAPLVFPIAIQLGIDPIHLGIIMVVNMEIGMITPPVGLNLFVTAGVANMSVMGVVRAALPFLGVLMIFLVIITYVPWISTVLPNAMMGPELILK